MPTRRRSTTFLAVAAFLVYAAPSLSDASSASAATTTTTSAPPSSTSPPTAQVVVSAFSEKGDFIDNGVSAVYTSRWRKVTVTTSGVSLSYFNRASKTAATFSFAPVAGQLLAVGEYDNVQRAATRSAGFPGLEITGPGRPTGCTRLTGSFHIWDIAATASGVLTRLDLTWVEHCGAGRPSNFGEVLINDAPRVGELFASATRITFPDQTPTLPYVLTNPTSRTQPVSLWQSATTLSHFTLIPARVTCATSVPAKSTCTYLIRLLPPRPGMYSATVLAVSKGATVQLALTGPAGGV